MAKSWVSDWGGSDWCKVWMMLFRRTFEGVNQNAVFLFYLTSCLLTDLSVFWYKLYCLARTLDCFFSFSSHLAAPFWKHRNVVPLLNLFLCVHVKLAPILQLSCFILVSFWPQNQHLTCWSKSGKQGNWSLYVFFLRVHRFNISNICSGAEGYRKGHRGSIGGQTGAEGNK